MTASLCWVSPWHPGDEAAKELLSQCLGQTAACLRGLVYDHGTVEQVSTEKNRQNEINTESIHIKLDKLQQFQVTAGIHSSLHSHTNKFTTCILIWKDRQSGTHYLMLTWRCSWKHMWTLGHRLRPQTQSWSRHKGSGMSRSPHRTQKSHEGKTWSVWAVAAAVAGRNGSPDGEHNVRDMNSKCQKVMSEKWQQQKNLIRFIQLRLVLW